MADDSRKIYRETMLEALSGLYPTPKDWPNDPGGIVFLLEERFSVMETAVEKLKGSLSTEEAAKLDDAWKTFHHAYHGKKISERERRAYEQMGLDVPQTIVGNGMLFTHYLPIHNSGEQPPALPEHQYLFKKNAERLLTFADNPKASPLGKSEQAELEALRKKQQLKSEQTRSAAEKKNAGNKENKKRFLEVWASGRYKTKAECAEMECDNFGISYETATKWLRNQPRPK